MELNRFALAQVLGEACVEKGLRIAMAESCTGGAVSEVITAVSGSSQWFDAGFITYSNAAKTRMLSVKSAMIDDFGAVSKPVAIAMAEGALTYSEADIAIAVTGVAGPDGGTEEKPVGTIWFALADRKHDSCEALSLCFTGGRKHIRRCATAFSLEWFLKHIAQRQ